MPDLFSVPIFFIVFRETVEAAIIVSVLLSFVEQLMATGKIINETSRSSTDSDRAPSVHNLESSTLLDTESPATEGENTVTGTQTKVSKPETTVTSDVTDDQTLKAAKLIRRMRIQIWAGTLAGFIVALSIGAAFIAVFYTKLTDLWAQTEDIWEGVFSIIAAIIIYIMGMAFLKMDRARIKWRYKLAAAFEHSQSKAVAHHRAEDGALKGEDAIEKREGKGGKWALFLLPFITVMREGLEAVVFVGGVSLNEQANSIPIAVIVGLICGAVVGYIIYRTGSTTTLHWFLVGSTSFLFLIGAGLMSKGVGSFQYYRFAQGVGSDVGESGDGPGSFQVAGNVWHLTYGNPETGAPSTNGGWQLFNAILGWNNTATLGSILSYVFYWILIIVTLIYLRWSEGRVLFFGKGSKAYHERMSRRYEGKSAGQQHEMSYVSPTEEKKSYLAGDNTDVSRHAPAVPTLHLDD